MHAARTVRKLVHKKQIEPYWCVAAGAARENSVHDATLKIDVFMSLLPKSRIQSSWILCIVLRGQKLDTTTEGFHVPATCPSVCVEPHINTTSVILHYVIIHSETSVHFINGIMFRYTTRSLASLSLPFQDWISSLKVPLKSNSWYPFFYIFVHNKPFQNIFPNFKLLKTSELMFFGPLFPRIYGRH